MPGNAARCKNGLITINNYTVADVWALKAFADSKCKYFVGAYEVAPTTGTPHLQCAFVAKNATAVAAIHKVTESTLDLKYPIRALKGPMNAFDYCKKGSQPHEEWEAQGVKGDNHGKDLDLFCEFGEQPEQGRRSDLDDLRQVISGAPNFRAVLNDASVQETLARNLTFAKELFNAKLPKPMENFAPRPWQAALLEQLAIAPDDRTIIWVYDPQGAAGKTTLCNYLVRNKGATILAGKAVDMFHAYDMEPIVLIDIPRADNMEYLNYGAIEKLKDGIFFSGKYNSTLKVRDGPAHVVVFSNSEPDPTKWTADRLSVLRLSEPNLTGMADQFF